MEEAKIIGFIKTHNEITQINHIYSYYQINDKLYKDTFEYSGTSDYIPDKNKVIPTQTEITHESILKAFAEATLFNYHYHIKDPQWQKEVTLYASEHQEEIIEERNKQVMAFVDNVLSCFKERHKKKTAEEGV